MTCYLLDTNVLLPFLWPRHTEQARVRSWFLTNASSAFATCSLTQAGFLRLTTNPEAVREKYTLQQARALLFAFVQQPGHIFWPTTIDVFEALQPFESRMQGPKQITDAYLLGIAKHYGGKLVTMDEAMKSLAGPQFPHLVEMIP